MESGGGAEVARSAEVNGNHEVVRQEVERVDEHEHEHEQEDEHEEDPIDDGDADDDGDESATEEEQTDVIDDDQQPQDDEEEYVEGDVEEEQDEHGDDEAYEEDGNNDDEQHEQHVDGELDHDPNMPSEHADADDADDDADYADTYDEGEGGTAIDDDGGDIVHEEDDYDVAEDGAEETTAEGNTDDADEDDADEDDDEDEDDEDVADDDEPALKYQRLAADVPRIVTNDLITAFMSHEKLIVVGTDRGYVHVLDLNGNEITRMLVHRDRVLDLSLDASAEFVGSCSRDGTVVITNLYTKEQARHNYLKSIISLALPANYKQNVMFAAGGYTQQFFINSKGWFSNKDNVIHAGEGTIHAVRWRMDIVAWANDAGVKLYDVSTSELLSYIPRSSAKTPIDPQHPCTLCWMADDQLLVAWSSQVWIGHLRQRRLTPQEVERGVVSRVLHIVASFSADYVISGAAPFVNQQLLLLCFPRENLRDKAGKKPPLSAMSDTLRPELRIVTYANEEISVDALPIQGFVDCDPEDLHLDYQCPFKIHTPSASAGGGGAGVGVGGAGASSTTASLPPSGATTPSGSTQRSSLTSAPSPDSPLFTTEQLDFTFFIVAPHDVIIARPRDVDDHISWLLTRGDFPKALAVAQTHSATLKLYKLTDISEKFLTYLMESGEFEAVANECVKLLGTNKMLWEKWVLLFAKYEQLAAIRPFVPTRDPKLSEEVYEMVLQYYLVADPDGMLALIKEWSHHLYNMDRVIRAVVDRLAEVRAANTAQANALALQQRRRNLAQRAGGGGENATGKTAVGANESSVAAAPATTMTAEERSLVSVLGELYLLNKQYELGVQHLLAVGRTDVFHLVRSLDLFTIVKSKLLDLVLFDAKGAVDMFISNIDRLSPKDVIEQLSTRRDLLIVYLHELFVSDPHAAERYHDDQLELYAQYDADHLLAFLKKSTAYTLERALHVCQEYKLYKEMVFVLRRMGNAQLALTLIIDKLRDVKQAIAFVEEHKDDQLWEELINRSLDSPEFLSDLLEHVGSHYVDVLKLIRRIPPDLAVPNLKQKLRSILTDCALQQSVLVGARTILRHDCERLQQEMSAGLCKTIACVGPNTVCGVCSRRIIVSEKEREMDRRRERRARRLAANASANGASAGAAPTTTAAAGSDNPRDMDAIVFYCQHVYHRGCVGLRDRRAKAVCPRCSSTAAGGANANASSGVNGSSSNGAGAAVVGAGVPANASAGAGAGATAGSVSLRFESGLSQSRSKNDVSFVGAGATAVAEGDVGGGSASLSSSSAAAHAAVAGAGSGASSGDGGAGAGGHSMAMSARDLAAFYGKVPGAAPSGLAAPSVASAGLAPGSPAAASSAAPARRVVANLTSTLPASALSYSAARAAAQANAASQQLQQPQNSKQQPLTRAVGSPQPKRR